MSIALDRRNGIGGSGFGGGIPCFPIYESPEGLRIDRREEAATKAGRETEEGKGEESCSSSIGRNSECSAASSGSEGEESEVQSRCKEPLETMDALEESLPIRRGISKFYRGKSKSFTNLVDASSCSSAKDLAKPENPYNRKRKNLLAFSIMYERSQSNELRSMEGSISKRPAISSQCTMSSSISMSCFEGHSNSNGEHDTSRLLPPRYPLSRAAASVAAAPSDDSPPEKLPFPMRSFSLTDLEGAVSSSSSIKPREKHKRN